MARVFGPRAKAALEAGQRLFDAVHLEEYGRPDDQLAHGP
jgi:hypothetical protein